MCLISVLNRTQHTRLLFISTHSIFSDNDFLNIKDTPPYGRPYNSLLAFMPDTPYVLYSSKYLLSLPTCSGNVIILCHSLLIKFQYV